METHMYDSAHTHTHVVSVFAARLLCPFSAFAPRVHTAADRYLGNFDALERCVFGFALPIHEAKWFVYKENTLFSSKQILDVYIGHILTFGVGPKVIRVEYIHV